MLWCEEKEHNREASWLGDVRESFAGVRKQEEVVVTLGDVKAGIRKMTKWKTLDLTGSGVTGSKNSPCLIHPLQWLWRIVCHLGWHLSGWSRGGWFLFRRILQKGAVASNYRPIACLPSMWTLL